jgi:hypothetical protein
LQLYLSNVADLKIIKSQIERKKENREKLTKEEDDFLNDFLSKNKLLSSPEAEPRLALSSYSFLSFASMS